MDKHVSNKNYKSNGRLVHKNPMKIYEKADAFLARGNPVGI